LIGNILSVVLPVFIIAAVGYLSVKFRFLSSTNIDGLMRYALRFAVPCLLFRAISTLDLDAVFEPKLLISFYLGALICFCLGILGSRKLFGRRPGEAVVSGFGALFSNSLLIGLPVMELAYGVGSLAPNYAIISIHAPFCYLLGITTMEFSRADGRGIIGTVRAISSALFSNTLMIGLALGFFVNLGSVDLPAPVLQVVDMFARSALPVALFALGGILVHYSIKKSFFEAGMIVCLSLLLHPAIAWFMSSTVFDLPEAFVRSAVVTAAMAPGANAYIFASLYSRGQAQAASAVLLGTVLSVFTISMWLVLLGGVS
jgi:malonate transporter